MIDLHSHVLPGLDDGASDLDEAVAICRAAADDGTTILVATPHVRHDFPTSPEQMEEAVVRVQEAVGDLITLAGGGELDLDELDRADLHRFSLGGGRFLLVETPYTDWPRDLPARIFRLQDAGFGVVLAHPERNGYIQRRPALLQPLVAAGVLVQLTAASVEGKFGSTVRRCARTLLDERLAHVIASDVHGWVGREADMSAAVRRLDHLLARWLTEDMPRAILEGDPLPLRPPAAASRRWFSV